MYRVELKEKEVVSYCLPRTEFLMYRVELKEGHAKGLKTLTSVPNVPCGVERRSRIKLVCVYVRVPNVPCGVERLFIAIAAFSPTVSS